ncbi:MAG TPA: phosphoribosylaminoimidazolesuccinocarboxamide synthase [Candidatus Saccharimonadales bacterium]|nr:phosphoribosylaminoimidazolesuccinocarboxamide synthase [Candidatus Saccharimonadales bacterium]
MGTLAISTTDFQFPGQVGLYHGKVRDVYDLGDQLLMIATDRISAFDVIFPTPIPYKGQVLNQLAAHFLKATEDVVPNWLQATPDPNVGIGIKADPVKIELVIRGVLVGHAWREYSEGKRELCGTSMPDGLKEFDNFPEPIITPTSKAAEGHDEDITKSEILEQGLATAEEWEELKTHMRKLFARGQEMARARGLVLADTKYEFGRYDGKLILIDEIHTPDSSRYFYADSYDAYTSGKSSDKPKHLSKEFFREWLIERGFMNQPGQTMPELTDEVVQMVSDRYIELFETMTGEKFVKAEDADPLARIESNVLNYLQKGGAS